MCAQSGSFYRLDTRSRSLNNVLDCKEDPNTTNQGLFLSFATAADMFIVKRDFIFRIDHICAFSKPGRPQVGKSGKQKVDLFFFFPFIDDPVFNDGSFHGIRNELVTLYCQIFFMIHVK